MIALLLDHLWQSSLFAGGAGLLTLALRRNSANARFWLWFAASAKFLVPFALLAALGSYFPVPVATPPAEASLMAIAPMAQPFSGPKPILADLDLSYLFAALWAIGFLVISLRWMIHWWQLRRLLRDAAPSLFFAPIAVKFSATRLEPGLVGIFRPVILLPGGIEQQLMPAELGAIVAHELCHWRRRDNLLAAFHMLVEALFWFFPLVWWLGARLNAERERACDEAVLASGNDSRTYAEGILKICRIYLQSPLDCAAGVSGGGLKKRMETIMENRFIPRLTPAKKLLLGVSAMAAFFIPVAFGFLASPPALADASSQANGHHFSIQVVDENVGDAGPVGDDHLPMAKLGAGALWLKRAGQINGAALAEAHASTGRDGKPVIEFRLTPNGQEQFAEMTRDNIGHRLAVVVDGTVITAPTVLDPILGGKGEITGDFTTEEEANALVAEMTGRKTR